MANGRGQKRASDSSDRSSKRARSAARGPSNASRVVTQRAAAAAAAAAPVGVPALGVPPAGRAQPPAAAPHQPPLLRSPSAPQASAGFDPRAPGGMQSPRRSSRSATVTKTARSAAAAAAAAALPARSHMGSTSRARAAVPGAPTSAATAASIAAMGSGAGSDDLLLVYGGPPSPGGRLQGNPLDGPSVPRASWSRDQLAATHRLGDHLQQQGRTGVPNRYGLHYAEDAHHRAQSTGGRTDAAGAAPASAGSNIEDQAYEEGHVRLARRHSEAQVRSVDQARVRGSGPLAGSVATRERRLLMRGTPREPFVEVRRDLQDGLRDVPDKDEMRATRAAVAASTPPAPRPPAAAGAGAAAGTFEISDKPSPRRESAAAALAAGNDSAAAPYLSGVRSPGGSWRTGSDATEYMNTFMSAVAAQNPRPAAAASAAHQGTGSPRAPARMPPSPPRPASPYFGPSGAGRSPTPPPLRRKRSGSDSD